MLAWYLNFDCFHLFKLAHSASSPLRFLRSEHIIYAEILCLILIVLIHRWKYRFGIGLFANLSFLLALFLTQAWLGDSTHRSAVTSLTMGDHPYDAGLVAILLVASLPAAVASHLAFLCASLHADEGRLTGLTIGSAVALPAGLHP